MYNSHRRSNYRSMKRHIRHEKELPMLRKEAEMRRDEAFRKKNRFTVNEPITQQDHIAKYFAVG